MWRLSANDRTGLRELVQGTPAVEAIAATGGFLAELPKDQALPSWSDTTVADSADYVLAGPVDLGSWNVQIDCYAATREQAVLLAAANRCGFERLCRYAGRSRPHSCAGDLAHQQARFL